MSSAAASGDIEEGPPKIHGQGSDIPTEGISGKFSGPFFQGIAKRKRMGRDAKILVTARNAETGVGKSNLCDFLGYVFDTTKKGFMPRKICIEPEEYWNYYGNVPSGSVLVLEEGEQMDPRRAMSHENVEGSHKWMMYRVEEIVSLINLPSPKYIDDRFEEMADYWINVLRRGRARIYEKNIHDFKGYVYYQPMQDIEWPNMDGSATFERMEVLKQDRIDSGSGDWITPEEHEQAIEKARKNARQTTRDEIISAIYAETELTGGDIAQCSAIDISGSRVRQIAGDMT